MRKVEFSPGAIEDLKLFKSGKQNLAFKIFDLNTDIQANPFQGLGKPEALVENYSGF